MWDPSQEKKRTIPLPEHEGELLVATIPDEAPIGSCRGMMLGNHADGHQMLAPCAHLDTRYFEDVLEAGRFTLEIPTETFLSEVLAKKLKRLPARKRLEALACLMRERQLPRVIIVNHNKQPAEHLPLEEQDLACFFPSAW